MVAPVARIALNAEATESLERLRAADARLDAARVARLTLDPDRTRATTLAELGAALLPRVQGLGAGTATAFAQGLCATADAIVEHFPENLLWDLDALAAALVDQACRHQDRAPEELDDAFAEVLELHALFGRATAICFRYVHDFVYGFDWAKWVRRDPPARQTIGPYDRAFLRAMLRRGAELLERIEADDTKYPRLAHGQPRNPFGFSREPVDELRLHRELAVRDLIPVRAWQLAPPLYWDRPFADHREAHARALKPGGTARSTS